MSNRLIVKQVIVFMLFALLLNSSVVFAGGISRSGTLAELKNPYMLAVEGDRCYVIEGATVFVYSLKDFRLLRKFGKAGDGKGEIRVPMEGANTIRLASRGVLVESHRKLLLFSREGKLLKENYKSPYRTQYTPVGKNFAAKKYIFDRENNIQYMAVTLFDAQFKEIKELHREKWFQQYTRTGFQIQLFSDYLNFEVYKDRIYIERSPRGFRIDVYDADGNKLYHIKRSHARLIVTDADKEEALKALRKDRKAELMIKMLGSWEKVKEKMAVVFPVYKPPIRNFQLNNGKIYVRTFKEQNNSDQYIIMDLKGKAPRTVFLPIPPRPGVEEKMYDARFHYISDNTYYYLKENKELGVWQLRIVEIPGFNPKR